MPTADIDPDLRREGEEGASNHRKTLSTSSPGTADPSGPRRLYQQQEYGKPARNGPWGKSIGKRAYECTSAGKLQSGLRYNVTSARVTLSGPVCCEASERITKQAPMRLAS